MRLNSEGRTAEDTAAGPLPPAPFISIVVPVRNEERHLCAALDALLAQGVPPASFEICVVDGDSDDGTPALLEEYAQRSPCVRVLRNPRRGVAAGRNIGIGAARGELIVIVDGHSAVDGPLWLSKLAEVFARTGADCVGYPQPLAVDGSRTQQAIALARSSPVGRHPGSFNYRTGDGFVPAYGAAVAYRAAVFAEIGEFDESFETAEDMELNHRVDRAGLRCFFTSSMCARYQPRSTLAGLFRQQCRYGRGRMRLWRKHPATFSLAAFLPAAFLLVAAASWLALPHGLVAAVAVGYLLAASISAAIAARRCGTPHLLPLIFLALVTVHAGVACGSLWELAFGARTGTHPEERRGAAAVSSVRRS